jgi:hypothetical protein
MITRILRTVVPALAGLVLTASAFAQDSATLAADLQAADPAHWPAIDALLKAQRAELTAAHVASLAAANADTVADLRAAAAREAEALTAKQAAEADLAALKGRINTVLNNLLNAELQTGEGPTTALLRKLIAEAGKTDAELKREALESEIAAKQAELQKLQP